jgi:hypothetical protein
VRRAATRLWQDILPGFIAAGWLAGAESTWTGTLTPVIPLVGFLAASTVYAADHRLGSTTTKNLLWLLIGLSMILLTGLVTTSGAFHRGWLLLYVLLSVGYVLALPGRGFRLQDHPWLRVGLVSVGWGCIPLVIRDFPLERDTLFYVLGTAALFFSTVMWSDLHDRAEDLRQRRTTPAQLLRHDTVMKLIVLGYGISIAGYTSANVWLMTLPAMIGLLLMICGLCSVLTRYGDLFLLWPGALVLARDLLISP